MDTKLALCTFKQSERLRKAGFDWNTFPYVYVVKNYTNWGEDHYVGDLVTNPSSDTSKYISAPTVELALQWFEDVKGFKYNLQNNVNAGCWITPVFKGKYFAAIYAKNSKQAKSILLDELLTLIEEEKK